MVTKSDLLCHTEAGLLSHEGEPMPVSDALVQRGNSGKTGGKRQAPGIPGTEKGSPSVSLLGSEGGRNPAWEDPPGLREWQVPRGRHGG